MALALVIPSVLRADNLYVFNNAFSGTAPASTNALWLEATFRTTTPGTVQLTVSNLNLTASENVDQLYFNLATNLSPTSLSFSFGGGSGGYDLPSVSTGINAFKADGDGKYDILFDLATGGADSNRFTQGESLVCNITGIPTLSAGDFEYLSAPAGGSGPFYAAAHVQRIGTASLSGWISADVVHALEPIPEPGFGFLFGCAVSLWFAVKFGRRCAQALPSMRPQPIPAKKASRRK